MNDKVFLMGDFNARTGEMSDYILLDDEVSALPERKNKDRKVNNNGRQLVNLCKITDLVIVNGRTGFDRSGEYTCLNYNGSSVVDYMIVDQAMFDQICDFKVETFDPSLSDMHCALHCVIELPRITTSSIVDDSEPLLMKRWNDNIKENFVEAICTSEVKRLKQYLFQNTADLIDFNQVDTEIKEIILRAAKVASAIRFKKQNSRRKVWFDSECQRGKSYYKKVCRNTEDVGTRKGALRIYKNILRKKRVSYFYEFNKKLLKLRTNNPKDFWALLKSSVRQNEHVKTELKPMFEHFQKLNMLPAMYSDCEIEESEGVENPVRYIAFCFEEVQQAIKKLSNGKSAGADRVFPGFNKYAPRCLVELFTDFFNSNLASGTVPNDWSLSIICPIYKKGPPLDPNNYRGISLINCIGKIFASIITARLQEYLENNCSIGPEQAGFRKGFGCEDHILLLSKIVSIYLNQKKRLYVALIYYEKAFDLVDRSLLWQKLVAHNINGKILRILKNIYSKTACVRVNGKCSDFFDCKVGVRQGDILSPLLFTIFINDFEPFVRSHCNGLTLLKNFIEKNLGEQQTETLVNLLVLLYADDTIILTESEDDMQKTLDVVSDYCRSSNLKINCGKTKYMIFSRGKVRKAQSMYINGHVIERVDNFCYLGVVFKYNNTFQIAIKNNVTKAKKALFETTSELIGHYLSVVAKLHLFDSLITPILLYGCEVWGYKNLVQLEVFHRNFLKTVLQTRRGTPNPMVYGELGRLEIRFLVWQRMIGFWKRLSSAPNKYSNLLYKCIKSSEMTDPWLEGIQNILIECGIPAVFAYPEEIPEEHLMRFVKAQLRDVAIQSWRTSLRENTLCRTYSLYKFNYGIEQYLLNLRQPYRSELSRFRCASLVNAQTRQKLLRTPETRCLLCNEKVLADEYHLLLVCKRVSAERKEYLEVEFHEYPSLLKLNKLMNLSCTSKLYNLSKFCKQITNYVRCEIQNL